MSKNRPDTTRAIFPMLFLTVLPLVLVFILLRDLGFFEISDSHTAILGLVLVVVIWVFHEIYFFSKKERWKKIVLQHEGLPQENLDRKMKISKLFVYGYFMTYVAFVLILFWVFN